MGQYSTLNASRGRRRRNGIRLAVTVGFIGLFAPSSASAQTLQDFFFDVCGGDGSATATLATRCAETPAGGGDLSGDSEASMNPGQNVTANDAALARAQALTEKSEERLEKRREETNGKMSAVSGQGDDAEFGRLSLFVNGRAEFFDRDRDATDNERAYDGNTVGFQVGGDYRLSDRLVVGALIGVDRTDSEFEADAPGTAFTPGDSEGGVESDSYFLNVYGSYNVTDAIYVDGTVGIGHTDYEFERIAIFQESTRTVAQTNVRATGDSNGMQYSASFGGGYDFYRGAWGIGPYARVNYVRSEIDGYTESDANGTGLAMRVGDNDESSLTSVLGVQVSYAASTDFGVVVPQFRGEFEHEFRKDGQSVATSFAQDAAATTFTNASDGPDRNYFNVGASVVVILPNGWMPFFDAETLVSYDDLIRHRFTIGLRTEW